MEFWQHRLKGAFALKAAVTIALVALGDVMFFQLKLHAGAFGLYGLAMLAALAAARPAVIRQSQAAAALAFAALYALAMMYSASPLAWILFWAAATIATLLPGTSGFKDCWHWLQRLAFHALVSLLGPLPDFGRQSAVRQKRIFRTNRLQRLLPVVILPLVGSLVFMGLFAAANPVIEQWLTSFSAPRIDSWTLLRVMLWLAIIWLVWSLMRPRRLRYLVNTFDGRGEADIPGVSAASVTLSLIAFNVLFLGQNAMDAAWLWGLVPLPDGMTLASYAHRGAYPLIVTALLAALFVLVALRPGSVTVSIRPIRMLVGLWIGQNLFLVFNAALRTIDYIEAYSLTVLRISALLWMGLVALGLILVLWRMLANKSATWLINANLGAAGLLLTIVCFVDLGAVAAQWNVRNAREVGGDGSLIDLCYLNQLGGSALLPLIELEQRQLPDELHQRVRNVRLMVHRRLMYDVMTGGWDWISQRRLAEAEQRLGSKISLSRSERISACYQPPMVSLTPALGETETSEPALTEGADQ